MLWKSHLPIILKVWEACRFDRWRLHFSAKQTVCMKICLTRLSNKLLQRLIIFVDLLKKNQTKRTQCLTRLSQEDHGPTSSRWIAIGGVPLLEEKWCNLKHVVSNINVRSFMKNIWPGALYNPPASLMEGWGYL